MLDKFELLKTEYAEAKSLYEDYTRKMRDLIEELLTDIKSNIQYVGCRVKSIDSFCEKLEHNPRLNLKKFTKMQDLSGVRVIVYFLNDVEVVAGILRSNFTVFLDEDKSNPRGYNAKHLVIKLNENRLKLPEYARFKDLQCEVQITTVIQHGWSQASHDIVYKKMDLVKNSMPQVYDYLDKKMQIIAEKYITRAVWELDYINKEWKDAQRGVEIYKTNILTDLEQYEDNNEINNTLTFFREHLEKYGLHRDKYPKLIEQLAGISVKAEKNKVKAKKVENYTFPGATAKDINNVILNILRTKSVQLQYTKECIQMLNDFFSNNKFVSKDEVLNILKEIIEYDYSVLTKYDFHLQEETLNYLEDLKNKDKLLSNEATLTMLRGIGRPEFDGSETTNYNTITFKFGALNPNIALASLRNRGINLLETLFKSSKQEKDRVEIIEALGEYVHLPSRGNYQDSLKGLIAKNIKDIQAFLLTSVDMHELLVLDEISKLISSIVRHIDPTLVKDIRAMLEHDEEFQLFKTFYGYDIDDYAVSDFNTLESKRLTKIQTVTLSICPDTYKSWSVRLERYAQILKDTSDKGKFLRIYAFLNELGEKHFEFALDLIQKKESKLLPLIPSLLVGIAKFKKSQADKVIKRYIRQGKNLALVSQYLMITKDTKITIVKDLLSIAIKKKNVQVVASVISLVAQNYSGLGAERQIFTKAVDYLNKAKKYNWTFSLHFQGKSLLNDLTITQWEVVLEALLNVNSINYDDEEILKHLIEKNPRRVIAFFKQRIARYRKLKKTDRWKTNYDAVPYRLNELADCLRPHAEIIIEDLLLWYEDNDYITSYDAGRLIKEIAGSDSAILEKKIKNMLDTGGPIATDVIISILDAYHGNTTIYPLVKCFIAKKHTDSNYNKYKKNLMITLTYPEGAVSGEYGMVEHLKAVKENIKPWLEDLEAAVQVFAKEYIRLLDRQISEETKRTDLDITMRKIAYGE